MDDPSHKVSYPHFAFWAGLSVLVLFLLYQQSTSAMTLPGLFLSLGMLCFLSRGFCPTKERLRGLLYAVALVLFALSLVVSVRLFLSR